MPIWAFSVGVTEISPIHRKMSLISRCSVAVIPPFIAAVSGTKNKLPQRIDENLMEILRKRRGRVARSDVPSAARRSARPTIPCANRAMQPLRELDLKFTCIFR
jgi:hypothetical protein